MRGVTRKGVVERTTVPPRGRFCRKSAARRRLGIVPGDSSRERTGPDKHATARRYQWRCALHFCFLRSFRPPLLGPITLIPSLLIMITPLCTLDNRTPVVISSRITEEVTSEACGGRRSGKSGGGSVHDWRRRMPPATRVFPQSRRRTVFRESAVSPQQ